MTRVVVGQMEGPGMAGCGHSCDRTPMGALHKSAASVNFYGDDRDPAEITASLGAEPTFGVRKGGLRVTAAGAEKIASIGSWCLTAPSSVPGDLDGQINDLLGGLSDDLSAWQSFAQRYCERIFCGLFFASANEGISLQAKTLARIVERGLLVDFDMYGSQKN